MFLNFDRIDRFQDTSLILAFYAMYRYICRKALSHGTVNYSKQMKMDLFTPPLVFIKCNCLLTAAGDKGLISKGTLSRYTGVVCSGVGQGSATGTWPLGVSPYKVMV